MHVVMYGAIFQHIMCPKVSIYFASDADTEFGSGIGRVFEVGVEYEVGYKKLTRVHNDRKGGFDLEIGNSAG